MKLDSVQKFQLKSSSAVEDYERQFFATFSAERDDDHLPKLEHDDFDDDVDDEGHDAEPNILNGAALKGLQVVLNLRTKIYIFVI